MVLFNIDCEIRHAWYIYEYIYFLCAISKVRYDITDHFVSSIPQPMIFFDFFGVFWVGFRWVFFSSRIIQHVQASEEKSVGPQMAVFHHFSRGKKVPGQKKKKMDFIKSFSRPRHHVPFLNQTNKPNRINRRYGCFCPILEPVFWSWAVVGIEGIEKDEAHPESELWKPHILLRFQVEALRGIQ